MIKKIKKRKPTRDVEKEKVDILRNVSRTLLAAGQDIEDIFIMGYNYD